jgi:hypothetical protein
MNNTSQIEHGYSSTDEEEDGDMYTVPPPSCGMYDKSQTTTVKQPVPPIAPGRRHKKHYGFYSGQPASSDDEKECCDQCEDYTYTQRRVHTADQLECKPDRSYVYPKPMEMGAQLGHADLYHPRCDATHQEFWDSDESSCDEDGSERGACRRPRRFDKENAYQHAPEWSERYAIQERLNLETGPAEIGRATHANANPYNKNVYTECIDDGQGENPDMMFRMDSSAGEYATRTPGIKADNTRYMMVPCQRKPVAQFNPPGQTECMGMPPVRPCTYLGPRQETLFPPRPPEESCQNGTYAPLDTSTYSSMRENKVDWAERVMPPNAGYVGGRAPVFGEDMTEGARTRNQMPEPFPLGAATTSATTTGGAHLHGDMTVGSRRAGGTTMSITGMPSGSDNPTNGWICRVDDIVNGGHIPRRNTIPIVGASNGFEQKSFGWIDECGKTHLDAFGLEGGARNTKQLTGTPHYMSGAAVPNAGSTNLDGTACVDIKAYRTRPDGPITDQYRAADAPIKSAGDVACNPLTGMGVNRRPPTLTTPCIGGMDQGFAGEFSVGKSIINKVKQLFCVVGSGNYGKYTAQSDGCQMGGQGGFDPALIAKTVKNKRDSKQSFDDTPNASLLDQVMKYCPGAASIKGMNNPANFV